MDLHYPTLIDRVLLDETVLARANALMATVAADMYSRNHERDGLRVSDAGECVRRTWARVHDREDLPESPRGLRKMRDGSRTGAEMACLIVAGIEAWHPELRARCEVDVDYGGIPGHADVVVEDRATVAALEVVECKRTGGYWAPTKANPNGATPETKAPWYIPQACAYADAVGAETFVVLVDTYSDRDADLRQFRYFTAEWATDTFAEYARLGPAMGDEAPEGDAKEEFRCSSCRFSDCERNVNPLKIMETVDVFVDVDGLKEIV